MSPSTSIALLREVRACTLCADKLEHAPRPVLQCDPRARILIAGQAPGAKVHASGIPFQDPSGNRLRDWLGLDEQAFYDPSQLAILPMGFCYPGKGRSGDLPPRPECAPTWRARLLAELPNIRLQLIIGQYALAWHLPQASGSLTETVARWQDYWPDRLPLPHPSPRNNIWLRKNPWFEAEVLPALRQRVQEILAP